MKAKFDTVPYRFGETRVATLALLIFTALSGRCSGGVVITKFSGHAVIFRSSPTLVADTPMPASASTRIQQEIEDKLLGHSGARLRHADCQRRQIDHAWYF
jgi:hypothetical protein